MLTTFTVTNSNDSVVTAAGSAPGTLRQALFDANALPDPDVIQFAAGLSSVNLSIIGDIDPTAGASDLLVSSPVTIRGNSAGITIQRAPTATDRRLFRVASNGDLTLESIMLTGGASRGTNGGAGQDGGPAFGGAIYNQGMLHVVASTLYANRAIGGNTSAGSSSGAGFGGAIYNDGGTVSIHNSTLSGNSVSGGTGGIAASNFGGAIYSKNGTLQIYNSTITVNNATSGRELYSFAVGAGQMATLNVYSSIIAQADKVSAYDFVAASDEGADTVVTGSNNLIRSQNSYQSITIFSEDSPLLGDLANNGGPTLTHAILAGSPAIDLGANPQSFPNDQRGSSFARIVGSAPDIGAFEAQTIAGPALPGDYSSNQVVDAADYVVWRKTFGASVTAYSNADGNGSSSIDAGDYDVWRTHFGGVIGAGSASAESSAQTSTSVGLNDVLNQASSLNVAQLLAMSAAPVAASGNTGGSRLAGAASTLAATSDEARDLAVLALTSSDSNSRLPLRCTRLKFGSETSGELAERSEPEHLLGAAANPALLQTPILAAASTCIA